MYAYVYVKKSKAKFNEGEAKRRSLFGRSGGSMREKEISACFASLV